MIRRYALAAAAALPLSFGALAAKAADIVDTAVSAGQFETLVTGADIKASNSVIHVIDTVVLPN